MNPFARGPARPDMNVDALGARLTGTFLGSRVTGSEDRYRPRPGWYAYRVTGAAELPFWVAEVALTVERPAAPATEDWASDHADERLPSLEPRHSARTAERAPPAALLGADGRLWSRTGWSGPDWSPGGDDPVGGLTPVTDSGTGDPSWAGGRAYALLLLRARGRPSWLDPIAEAVAEIESLAGVGPAPVGVEPVPDVRGNRRLRLLAGPALPGLVPVAPAIAWSQLEAAGSRGLPAPLRRRWPAAGGPQPSWRATAGSVVTCDGPDGSSAQAVVALHGLGDVAAIAPPPGGALVLRAWKARRGWGMACGLVIGAASALGLGREAGRAGARARAAGWNASVLSGSVGLQLVRAGRPDLPPPEDATRAATDAQVAAMVVACLAAATIVHEATGPSGDPPLGR